LDYKDVQFSESLWRAANGVKKADE